MTLPVTLLLGVGFILIASALDNTPILSTFQKIMSGGVIDWSGKGTGPVATPTAPPNTTVPPGPTPPRSA